MKEEQDHKLSNYEQDPALYETVKKTGDATTAARWERVMGTGSSALDGFGLKSIQAWNRAGKNESSISVDQIIELYTWDESKKGKFPFC